MNWVDELDMTIRGLDLRDLEDITTSLKNELLRSVDRHEHYYKFPYSTFQEQEENKVNLLKFFAGLIGRIDLYTDTMRKIEEKFEEENE